MNKKLTILIIAVVVILAGGITWFVTAGLKEKSSTVETPTTSKAVPITEAAPALTLDNATERLTAAGFTIDSKDTVFFQMVGADDGFKTTVNNGVATIELYSFSSSKNKNAAQEQLTSSGTIFTNGDILILIDSSDNSGNPVDSEIIEKIKSTLQ